MKLKPRHKRRIYLSVLLTIGTLIVMAVFIPPFFNLNHLKPKIENNIYLQTGNKIKINGNINFSLMGPTIVANDISSSMGDIKSVRFQIPLSKIFDTNSIELPNNITINSANIFIKNLTPPKFSSKITIQNSNIKFMGKNYNISNAILSGGLLNGSVRTQQHKYDFDSNGDEFHITNKNEDLNISGHLYSDGSAVGSLSIHTKNINDFFEFNQPKIKEPVRLSMDFNWNGKYGFKFTNITGDNFGGSIELLENGHRDINLIANNIDMDLSFLMSESDFIYDTDINLDLSGNLKLAGKNFNKIKIKTKSDKNNIKIIKIIADDISIDGGKITTNGADKLPIYFTTDNKNSYCLFSGTPDVWGCSTFKYGSISGKLDVKNNQFKIFAKSDTKIPTDYKKYLTQLKSIGNAGNIDFVFADASGNMEIENNKKPNIYFDKIYNKSLMDMGENLDFVPSSLLNELGTFSGRFNQKDFSFISNSKNWDLYINKDKFILTGKNIKPFVKTFAPEIKLSFIKDDLNFVASGNFKNSIIANMKIKINGQTFTGTKTGNDINLKTKLLDIDSFINQEFMYNYEELQFRNPAPLTSAFDIKSNVSLSADFVIYNGSRFKNFVYSLKSGASQTFSITDNLHGNMLASISKNKNIYDITLQLNKFSANQNLLSESIPINIRDTKITAQIDLKTNGRIAYDVWNNLYGTIDMSFTGGSFIGLGTDRFYANAKDITVFNAESFLSNALDNGQSKIKEMRIVGKYNKGNFITTKPFNLKLRHTDITGNLETQDGSMSAKIGLIMRGTSPNPKPIYIDILPNGKHRYSLSEIMQTFDPDFLRGFIETHKKF